ncbi:uncharacterized protein LACBIDRAFT_321188 [Laccaria bicolor S238N-H82]|uniref:Predicted protein n=1 Tax=Laccaria bicolor (strain S238N-H82 / ATCC MYA-4686) TaxID=486041 RepID=B0CP09_LACBS|nr:uncharacterized protein LACBIDRAFT_321188 [Laccaria bicolor S238N-H82]EDR15390.1 predicted protein [Laccaria bicolor S238N-H82]|eukprot:XP_001873598.1 predicted protein [Laccaria bicolor S238N-H82]
MRSALFWQVGRVVTAVAPRCHRPPRRSYLLGRSLDLDLDLCLSLDLKPRPLPPSDLGMQVLPYEYFYTSMGFHSFGCVPTCFAFYKRTFKVDFLARVEDRGRKSTSKSAPAAKPPPFEHPSFRCFQYLVVEDATDPGFTFDKRLANTACSCPATQSTWKQRPIRQLKLFKSQSTPLAAAWISSMFGGYPHLRCQSSGAQDFSESEFVKPQRCKGLRTPARLNMFIPPSLHIPKSEPRLLPWTNSHQPDINNSKLRMESWFHGLKAPAPIEDV